MAGQFMPYSPMNGHLIAEIRAARKPRMSRIVERPFGRLRVGYSRLELNTLDGPIRNSTLIIVGPNPY
jgi:hypothetical protein